MWSRTRAFMEKFNSWGAAMVFLISRIALVFCGVALSIAFLGDLIVTVLVHSFGGIGVFGVSESSVNKSLMFLLGAGWILATVLGWIVASKLNLVPRL